MEKFICPYKLILADHKTSSSCIYREYCNIKKTWCSEIRKTMHSDECILYLKRKENSGNDKD